MSTPGLAAGSRFRAEIHDHKGFYVCSLDYSQIQGEFFLNDCSQIRLQTFFKNDLRLMQSTLKAGKHELWIYDTMLPSNIRDGILFSGPIWTIVASGEEGTLNISAQDSLSYLKYRVFDAGVNYNTTGAAIIGELLNFTDSKSANAHTYILRPTIITGTGVNIVKKYVARDLTNILDAMQDLVDLGDGVDFKFVPSESNTDTSSFFYGHHGVIHACDGHFTQGPSLTLDYGGMFDSYAYQDIATSIGNSIRVGSDQRIGAAIDTVKITEYDYLYERTLSADGNNYSQANLNAQAAAELKKRKDATKVITVVLRGKDIVPFKTIDLGDLINLRIDDNWVQYDDVARVVGFQLSVGSSDEVIMNLYTNDDREVE